MHPAPAQNHQGRPGLYRFYLAHTWSTTLLEDGYYRLEVEASELRGNVGRLGLVSRSQTSSETGWVFGRARHIGQSSATRATLVREGSAMVVVAVR